MRGVNRSGLEYACIQGWRFFDSPHPDQIATPGMVAAMRSWDINVVPVPLNEDCWLGLHTARGRGGRPYRRIVAAYVWELNAAHLYAILDLHLAAPGAARATTQLPMADRTHAPAFWRSVARTFKRNHAVLFELYNEPYGSAGAAGCMAAAFRPPPRLRPISRPECSLWVNAVRSGARPRF
ncbi:MAG: cellulase family glycosylhydrolase [Solirubrobacteraceae bacterium]